MKPILPQNSSTTDAQASPTPELLQWLNVSGDMDDFIYYGEENHPSER